jgi:hypothetical protein
LPTKINFFSGGGEVSGGVVYVGTVVSFIKTMKNNFLVNNKI